MQLAAEQPLTKECWTPPKIYTPLPRAKRKPQQDGKRGEIACRIKPHMHQRRSEGSDKALCAPRPRGPTDSEPDLPVFEYLLQRQGSAEACHRGRGSGCCRTGPYSGWHKPSWRRVPLTPPSSCQADDPETAEQLHEKTAHTVKKVLGPPTDFTT